MTESELKKLRKYYFSLEKMQKNLQDSKHTNPAYIPESRFNIVYRELQRIKTDFPYLIPCFSLEDFIYSGGGYPNSGYSTGTLTTYLASVIGKLESAIYSQDNTPVTESRDFAFVKDSHLRQILERDYKEIQQAFRARCWKSVIILSGSAIEAILLDCLKSDPTHAASASKAPNKPDLSRWDLNELIDVCVELDFVKSGVEKLSHSVREYRNLVHPGNEIRNRLVFGQEEARIAFEVLNIVHRDLSP